MLNRRGKLRVCRDCKEPITTENTNPSNIRKNNNLCRKCQAKREKDFRRTHPDYDTVWHRKARKGSTYQDRCEARRNKRRIIVMKHYSNGTNKCAGCGIEDIVVLTIDHINGGGTQHRKKIHQDMYNWLIKNNFPEGYQVLCWNCQYRKKIKNREMIKGWRPSA